MTPTNRNIHIYICTIYIWNNFYISRFAGAEPSPAYFNILTWGNETEVLDGTQLAADYTFSGLQKFGEGLEERLRGLKMPNKLLEKVSELWDAPDCRL